MALQWTVDREKGVATVTFNRPEALNALNRQTLKELDDVLDDIEKDNDVRCLILTGAGEKAFVAGADITEIRELSLKDAKSFAAAGQEIIGRLEQLNIPVIAAVNGYALGGGCEIALACDFIYAAEEAIFGLPEIKLGIIPGFGGTQRLPRRIGVSLAREMIFSGKHIGAGEAREIGLVNKVFEKKELLVETEKMAGICASHGKTSLAAAKQAINRGSTNHLKNTMWIEQECFATCFTCPDVEEGTSAFLEKRRPNFEK